MTLTELAACLAAAAFAVLVGFVVPVLINLRKTVAESERLMTRLNADLPALSSDLRSVTQNLNALTDQARNGVEHASVLLHAVGEPDEVAQRRREPRGQRLRLPGGEVGQFHARSVSGGRAARTHRRG